jgi:hypothetical protein
LLISGRVIEAREDNDLKIIDELSVKYPGGYTLFAARKGSIEDLLYVPTTRGEHLGK